MGAPLPLSARPLFRTADLDEARAIVAEKFCDHRLDRASRAGAFDAVQHRAEGQALSLNVMGYGAEVRIDPGRLGSFYLVQIPLRGLAEVENGAGAVASGRGLGTVLNPHREARMRWGEGCVQLLLQIDARRLNRAAERLAGRPLGAPVTFSTAIDEARGPTAGWLARLRTCVGLTERGALFSRGAPHTQALAEEQLIESFLLAQPSDVSDLLRAGAAPIPNLHVRRAAERMRARLSEPIAIGDIAAELGVTTRHLQQGFRDVFGMSPTRFLREERLQLARRMLRAAGPEALVGDVAEAAGFAHFGRFSTEYRRRFGETPRETRDG